VWRKPKAVVLIDIGAAKAKLVVEEPPPHKTNKRRNATTGRGSSRSNGAKRRPNRI